MGNIRIFLKLFTMGDLSVDLWIYSDHTPLRVFSEISFRLTSLEELLNVQFQRADRISEFKAFQYGWMEDAEDADNGFFAIYTEMDRGSVAGKEGRVFIREGIC